MLSDVRSIVAVLPLLSVIVNLPLATPAPPLSDERSVFSPMTFRCMSPLLTEARFVAPAAVLIFSLVAVFVASASATAIDPVELPEVSIKFDAIARVIHLRVNLDAGRGVDRDDNVVERLGVLEIDRVACPGAVGERDGAQRAESLAAVQAAERNGLQSAEDSLSGNFAAGGGNDAIDRAGIESEIVQGERAVFRLKREIVRSRSVVSVSLRLMPSAAISSFSFPPDCVLTSSMSCCSVVSGLPCEVVLSWWSEIEIAGGSVVERIFDVARAWG